MEIDIKRYTELLNQANTFVQKNLLSDALTTYKEALLIYPHSTEVMIKLASLYSRTGRPEKAIKTCCRIIDLMDEDTPLEIRAQLMEQEKKYLFWDRLDEDFKFFQKDEVLESGILPPFIALSNPLNNEQLLKTISASTKHNAFFQPKPCPFSFKDRTMNKEKLNLGFVSGDLRNHPVGFVLAEFFELIDRDKFDVYLYDTHPDEQAETHHRIYSTTPYITAIDKMDDRQAAQKIFDDGIDVLIDLSGYTSFNRLGLFTYHPAPAQGTFLGFLGTLGGISGIDYNFADEFSVPPDQQKFYAEKIKYLSTVHRLMDRKIGLSEGTFTHNSFGIPDDAIILNCFNNSYKYTPNYFDLWSRILKRVPKAILWFYKMDSFTEKNMLSELVKRGIEKERIFFTEYMPHHDHLKRYAISDLLLDTEYYNAHTTAMEALFMGCPMITCPGETFTSRAGGAILTALGMPEMICKDVKEYEEKVVELCNTPGALEKLRKKTTELIKTSDLFNIEKFARSFEKNCREMYEESLNMLKKSLPSKIDVNLEDIFAHANKNSVLIFEAQPHHGECLPSWIKYFTDLNYHVDVFVLPEMVKQNPFVRLPKDLDYSVIEIPLKNRLEILKNEKILNYKHVLISTAIYDYRKQRSVLQEFEGLKKHPSLYIVEHDLRYVDCNNEREYAQNNKMITLWNFKMGTCVNPSYFGNVQITPKSEKTTFIVVGNVTRRRKNYQLLFDSIKSLLQKTKNFHVVIVGRIFDKYFIPKEIKPYITLTGQLNFPEMYNYMEKADFFLPLLDINDTNHECYLNSVTTGSLQLILGFKKIPLIQDEFAKFYEFDAGNALIYTDNMENAMLQAIDMSSQTYQNLQHSLDEKAQKIKEKSYENLKNILAIKKNTQTGNEKKLNLYCFTSYFNFGDQLNFYLLRYLNYPFIKTSYETADVICIGSILEHFLGNHKVNDRPLHVFGSGFLYPEISQHRTFSRNMIFHALRGKLSQKRCEQIIGKSLEGVALGDPGLLIKNIFPNISLKKKYDVGIILHEYDKNSPLLKNINIKNASYTVFNTSLPPEEFIKKVAECEFIFSSALHGIICADSLGIPNQHIILTPDVGTYKFQDYYSVFDDCTYMPTDLKNSIIDKEELYAFRDNYQDRSEQVESVCAKLLATFEKLGNFDK